MVSSSCATAVGAHTLQRTDERVIAGHAFQGVKNEPLYRTQNERKKNEWERACLKRFRMH